MGLFEQPASDDSCLEKIMHVNNSLCLAVLSHDEKRGYRMLLHHAQGRLCERVAVDRLRVPGHDLDCRPVHYVRAFLQRPSQVAISNYTDELCAFEYAREPHPLRGHLQYSVA